MPRIRDNIRDCAVYLYPSRRSAEAGTQPVGSGFLVGIPSKTSENCCHPYVVTNRHIVAEGATVVRLNTRAGQTDIVEFAPEDWVFHSQGDDLAVTSIDLHSNYHDYMLVNDPQMFLTREWMGSARVGLGDDVFMVGRLINHEGRQQNTPLVRFGQIAMMPGEAIRLDNGQMQECFLVDVPSIGGLTGSPVFVTVHYLRLRNPVEFNHEWFPHLLGVNCGHIPLPLPLMDPSTRRIVAEPLMSASQAPLTPLACNGLMIVLPAWRLEELLNHPRLLEARIMDDELNRQPGIPSRAGRFHPTN